MITAAEKSAHVAVRQAIRARSKPGMACLNQSARVAATVKVIAKGERTQPWPKVFLCHAAMHVDRMYVMYRIGSTNWYPTHTEQRQSSFSCICANCRYEWTSTNKRCEIHKVRGNNFSDSSQNRDDTECCWRVTSSGGSKSSKSGGSKSSKGGRRLGHADEDPRRQVSRHGRDLAAGRKLRGRALRSGQKMDAFNAWE